MNLFAPFLIVLSFLFSNSDNSQNVELTITGIRSSEGKIRIGLFEDDQTFQKETAAQNFEFEKTGLKNGEMTVQLKLESGIIGLSLLDDENGNSEMDYNFFGLPKEGFGFSNYYHSGFTKPVFEDFDFELNKPDQQVEIKIRYIL